MSEKEPVRLRTKPIANDRRSIYLDIYVNGRRRYEFLKLYLLPDVNRANKEKNRETMRLANAVKAKRIVEIQNGRFGFDDSDIGKTRLFTFIERMIDARRKADTMGNYRNWKGFLGHLMQFEKRKNITIAEVTAEWLEKFKQYLMRAKHQKTGEIISKNTQTGYYKKMVAVLNKAVKEGIIIHNPAHITESPKWEDSERTYLTIDEVKTLAEHPGRHQNIKDAFLFSCLTGLRKSDVINLTWQDVEDTSDGCRITFRQKKTKGLEYLFINEQARKLMGERKDMYDHVFRLPPNSYVNQILRDWMIECGISKHICYHSSRHTFATMMLTLGNDLYTTSKLLGHRDVSTTQIYARIIDEKKKDAVDKIPDIL